MSANGILEFQNGPLSDLLMQVNNTPFPIDDHAFIAPFYADFDVGRGGGISYSDRPVKEAESLDKAQEQIRSFTEYKGFKPLYLIIATWVKVVGYFNRPNDLVNEYHHPNSFQFSHGASYTNKSYTSLRLHIVLMRYSPHLCIIFFNTGRHATMCGSY